MLKQGVDIRNWKPLDLYLKSAFDFSDGEPTNVVPPITDDNSSAQTISLEIACLLLTLSLAFINRIL